MCFSATRYSSALENFLDSGESFGGSLCEKERERKNEKKKKKKMKKEKRKKKGKEREKKKKKKKKRKKKKKKRQISRDQTKSVYKSLHSFSLL